MLETSQCSVSSDFKKRSFVTFVFFVFACSNVRPENSYSTKNNENGKATYLHSVHEPTKMEIASRLHTKTGSE